MDNIGKRQFENAADKKRFVNDQVYLYLRGDIMFQELIDAIKTICTKEEWQQVRYQILEKSEA